MQSHVSQALDHRGKYILELFPIKQKRSMLPNFICTLGFFIFLQSLFFAVMTAHLLTLAVAS